VAIAVAKNPPKPFNGCREALLKQIRNQMTPNNKGAGNADIHPESGLSRVPQKRASGHGAARSMAMTEVATSLLALLSVGISRPIPPEPNVGRFDRRLFRKRARL